MQLTINNTTVELNGEGRGLISKYNPEQNETLTIAHSFSVTGLASVDECMQTVAALCDGLDIPAITDSKEAVAFLAMQVLEVDKECQQGLISEEDYDKDICTVMWLIASLTNAKWFEVFFDQGNVLFWSMTAEDFAEREQQLAGKLEQAA